MSASFSDSQGRIALVIILIVVGLLIGSFYLGKISSQNNSFVAMPSSQPTSLSATPMESPATAQIQSSQPQQSPVPTFTPSPKPDVETTEEADAKRYTSNKYGFSYKFSKSLIYNNSSSDPDFAQFLENQSGVGNATRMVMQVFQNPSNSSLEEVIKREKLLDGNNLGPKYEYSTIQGREAVKLTKTMTQNEICNDGNGTTKNRTFFFLVKGDGYVLEIHPNDSCESFKRNWFDITPQTFSLI